MEIVKPSYKIITPNTTDEGTAMVKLIEASARTCYQSEDKITADGSSAVKLVSMLRDRKHHAMLEFGIMIVKFVCDRGVSHELVRHRLASFAQESTRYVRYGDIAVVIPDEIAAEPKKYDAWEKAMLASETAYKELLDAGCAPQIARSVLPTCLKTEIVIQGNLREWRHIFQMRTPAAAHPQMRELMVPLLDEVKQLIPVVFDDL